jgi:hypothetical protein
VEIETMVRWFSRPICPWVACAIVVLAIRASGAAGTRACQQVTLAGEVTAGQKWKAAFGQGWVFRVLPIRPGQTAGRAGYSGWDLVVDREPPSGFPDALLVASPPYNSINEREVGTSFGLRAQDAIGWNPRSFRFLTYPDAFGESRRLFEIYGRGKGVMQAPGANSREGRAMQRQLKINEKSAAGQFRILDARVAPGIADAAAYAENWALAFKRTPHTLESATGGRATPLGEIHWIRFSVTLWLPAAWKVPREIHAARVDCSEGRM